MIVDVLLPLAQTVLGLLLVLLVIHVVISWLFAFDIISRRNEFVNAIWRFTSAMTDPVLRPLRRLIPPIAGVDLSVLVLMVAISLLRNSVLPWLAYLLAGRGSLL